MYIWKALNIDIITNFVFKEKCLLSFKERSKLQVHNLSHSNLFHKLVQITITTQVRIAEGDNTAQYWPNLGSQESAIVIGPVSLFASVKCWADDGGLFRLFKFTDLQPKLGPVSALYQADYHFYYGIQFWK